MPDIAFMTDIRNSVEDWAGAVSFVPAHGNFRPVLSITDRTLRTVRFESYDEVLALRAAIEDAIAQFDGRS